MMKKFALIMVVAVLFASLSFGFSILDNTKVDTGLYPQSVTAASNATTTAISLKGYERCHIVVPYTMAATSADVSIQLRFLEAATSGAVYTEIDSVTALATPVNYGILELEAIKNLQKPYIKAEITPTGSNTTAAITIIYYGAPIRPF